MEDFYKKTFNEFYVRLFIAYLQNGKDHIVDILKSNIERGMGKTRVINEIGLTYQALGYEVILMTPYDDEHIATVLLRNRIEDIKYCFPTKTICLVDEWDFHNKNTNEFLYYLKRYKVPIVGFGYNLLDK